MKKTMIMRMSALLILAFMAGLTGCAPVTLKSNPEGASVYYKDNDKLIGQTPIKVNLIANGKELLVRKPGYFSKTVVVSPIDPESVSVDLRRRDKVLILSKPQGVELYAGAKRLGRTPYRVDYSKPYRKVTAKATGYVTRTCAIPDDPEGDIMIKMERLKGVIIESKPVKCEVFTKSGRLIGVTPVTVPAEETAFLEMRKEGYYSKAFKVDKQTQNPCVIPLEREPIIIVYSEPTGALVVHRGVTLGKTPYRTLVKKDMDLELVSDRYYTRQITVAPDSPREVRLQLDPKPYVTIMSTPPNAALYRSGGVELLGTTPVEVLIEKDTAFEMHLAGYDIKPFMLSPESSHEVNVPLRQTLGVVEKMVVIDSKPSGAKVFRPGGAEFIGETPLRQHVRGERTFELQLEGFETKIVTVAPDSADSVVFALAKDESSRNVTVSDPLLNTPSSF